MKKDRVPDKIRVKRIPERGIYDKETVYNILDRHFLCHISFTQDHEPYIIPTAYGRSGDYLYIHGSSKSSMLQYMSVGIQVAVGVTEINGLVLSKSIFHHSMNYSSAIVYGNTSLVTDNKEKLMALKIISDQILLNRWEETRLPNEKELKATSVIKISIDQFSAKARSGDPSDDLADVDLDVWAGILPISVNYGSPEEVSYSNQGKLPKSIIDKNNNG